MKIIFYYRFLGLGGVETSIINRIKALSEVGIEAEFWFSKFYGEGAKYIASNNFIHQVESFDKTLFEEIDSYDAITVIDFPELINDLEDYSCSIPVIYETHASFPPALPRYYTAMESDKVSAIVVPSRFNRDLILKSTSPKSDPIVIRNCVDFDCFSCEAPPARIPGHGVETGPKIIWIGRLEDEKNPLELISIALRLSEVRNDLQFLIVGDTLGYENFLEKARQSAAGGIPASVNFISNVKYEDMPGIYNLAAKSGGLLLSTSSYESVPMTFIEAMSCACPVISSAVGGVNELICDGQNGLLYQAGDIMTAANLINELTSAGHQSSRNSIVANGLKHVQTWHSKNAAAASYISLFDRLMG